jgi:hypothetical protein
VRSLAGDHGLGMAIAKHHLSNRPASRIDLRRTIVARNCGDCWTGDRGASSDAGPLISWHRSSQTA